MSDKLIVSWEQYHQTVEKLAIKIEESNYKPTILVGIMRGAAQRVIPKLLGILIAVICTAIVLVMPWQRRTGAG